MKKPQHELGLSVRFGCAARAERDDVTQRFETGATMADYSEITTDASSKKLVIPKLMDDWLKRQRISRNDRRHITVLVAEAATDPEYSFVVNQRVIEKQSGRFRHRFKELMDRCPYIESSRDRDGGIKYNVGEQSIRYFVVGVDAIPNEKRAITASENVPFSAEKQGISPSVQHSTVPPSSLTVERRCSKRRRRGCDAGIRCHCGGCTSHGPLWIANESAVVSLPDMWFRWFRCRLKFAFDALDWNNYRELTVAALDRLHVPEITDDRLRFLCRKADDPEASFETSKQVLERLRSGDYGAISRGYGRVYHLILQLPRLVRRELKYVKSDGEIVDLVEIDLSSSYYALLATRLRKYDASGLVADDTAGRKLAELIRGKRFYWRLAELAGEKEQVRTNGRRLRPAQAAGTDCIALPTASQGLRMRSHAPGVTAAFTRCLSLHPGSPSTAVWCDDFGSAF